MSQEHYFHPLPRVPSRPLQVVLPLRGLPPLQLWTDRGVFSYGRVDPGTRLLVDCFEPDGARRVVDLGAGYGALGLGLARRFAQLEVILVELNQRAAALCRANAAHNALANARCLVGDGLSALAFGCVDALVSNPPVRAGRRVLLLWLEQARQVVRPGGSVWLVVKTSLGAPSLARWLQERFGDCQVVERHGGYRVLRSTVR